MTDLIAEGNALFESLPAEDRAEDVQRVQEWMQRARAQVRATNDVLAMATFDQSSPPNPGDRTPAQHILWAGLSNLQRIA